MIRPTITGAGTLNQVDTGDLPVAEIEDRIFAIQSRFLEAKGEERQKLTLEFIRLKEALEDARERLQGVAHR